MTGGCTRLPPLSSGRSRARRGESSDGFAGNWPNWKPAFALRWRTAAVADYRRLPARPLRPDPTRVKSLRQRYQAPGVAPDPEEPATWEMILEAGKAIHDKLSEDIDGKLQDLETETIARMARILETRMVKIIQSEV